MQRGEPIFQVWGMKKKGGPKFFQNPRENQSLTHYARNPFISKEEAKHKTNSITNANNSMRSGDGWSDKDWLNYFTNIHQMNIHHYQMKSRLTMHPCMFNHFSPLIVVFRESKRETDSCFLLSLH